MPDPKKKNLLRQRQDAKKQVDPNSYDAKASKFANFNKQTDTLITGKSQIQDMAQMTSDFNASQAAAKLATGNANSIGNVSGTSRALKGQQWHMSSDGSYEVRNVYDKEKLKNTFKKL